MITSALSLVVLAAAPQDVVAALMSAMAFGATFILVTGLFGIWSVNIFNDRPSAGMGATFFLISAGQFIGPSISGLIAGRYGLTVAFNMAAATCLAGTLLAPRRDIHSMSDDSATLRDRDTQVHQ